MGGGGYELNMMKVCAFQWGEGEVLMQKVTMGTANIGTFLLLLGPSYLGTWELWEDTVHAQRKRGHLWIVPQGIEHFSELSLQRYVGPLKTHK